MGKFTKSLLFAVCGLFLLLAILSATGGQWTAALGAMVLFTAVVYFGVVGWFASTLKGAASDAPNVTTNLNGALKALANSNAGWRSKLVLYVVPAAYIGMLGIRLWQLWR